MENWERQIVKKEGVRCLPYSLQVVLPEKCPDCDVAIRKLIDGMTRMFNGTTTFKAEGTWVDDKGHVIPEAVLVVESAHSCLDNRMENEFINLVQDCARLAHQDAIAVKQGRFLIIDTKREEKISIEPRRGRGKRYD
jgi:hypothetical protein